MAVLYPDNLGHNNPTKALLDDSQLRGAAVSVTDAAARNAIPEDKRKQGMIVTYVSGIDMITKRYKDSDIGDVAWTTEANWEEIGSGGSGGNPFDQDLNTTDSPVFTGVTTPSITSDNQELLFNTQGGQPLYLDTFVSTIKALIFNISDGSNIILATSPLQVAVNKKLVVEEYIDFNNSTLDSGNFTIYDNGSIVIGSENDSNLLGNNNIAIGTGAGTAITSGGQNILLGQDSGSTITTGGQNILIGFQNNNVTTGTENISLGGGQGLTTNSSNVFTVGAPNNFSTSHALLTGTFDATATNQTFDINAKTTIQNNIVLSSVVSGSGTQGELRNNTGVLEFYDGTDWRVVSLEAPI